MTVLQTSREDLTKEDLYFLMVAESKKMADVAGQTINVKDWVLAQDDKDPENIKTILFVRSDNETYATISNTFIESFQTVVQCFRSDFTKIKVKSNKSNKGRTFITCEYAKA